MNYKWKNKLELKCWCCKNPLTQWKWIHELFRGKFKCSDLHLRNFSVSQSRQNSIEWMNQGDDNNETGREKRGTPFETISAVIITVDSLNWNPSICICIRFKMYTRKFKCKYLFCHSKNIIITHHLFTSVSVVYCSFFRSVSIWKKSNNWINVKSILIERPFCPDLSRAKKRRRVSGFRYFFICKQQRAGSISAASLYYYVWIWSKDVEQIYKLYWQPANAKRERKRGRERA